ncbi:MAG TPA: hypothetical protein VIA62_16425 [Thermoanaerobaculia bacterium]|jgi:pterin-4a-carbinolamine dehydratase|nr:hypothetical protein [Thermoanaerobaculia bacterium]
MEKTQTTLDLPGGDNPLKPERVQKGAALAAAAIPLRPAAVQARLRREHAEELLKALPGWELTVDAKALNRARELPTPAVASLYSAFVTGFAGALSLPATVSVSGGQVMVTLHARHNHGRLGTVTDAVLDFARRLG